MKNLDLTSEEFSNLEPFRVMEGTIEKESSMYHLPDENKIIKAYNNSDDKYYLMRKLRAIRNLLEYTSKTDMPELLTPHGFLTVDNQVIGAIYPIIDAYTARTYLYSEYINMELKVEILKKIGTLLEKIKNSHPKYNAAFSDVHIDNFLIEDIIVDENKNINDISLVACDTDSMRILDSKGNPSYYLCDVEKLGEIGKYRPDCEGNIIPDFNSDLYCYNMILLDFISKSNYVYCLGVDEYNRYIDYLDKINVDPNILSAFESVYRYDMDNLSPLEHLDALHDINEEASLQSFYRKQLLF